MSSKDPFETPRTTDSNMRGKSPLIRKNIGVVVPNNIRNKPPTNHFNLQENPIVRTDDIHSLLNINMESICEAENESSPLRGRNSLGATQQSQEQFNRSFNNHS
jgi:hypothetical protein